MTEIAVGQAALRVAKQIAREILDKGDDPLRSVKTFESLWARSGYAKEIQALGTMHVGALDRFVVRSVGSEMVINKYVEKDMPYHQIGWEGVWRAEGKLLLASGTDQPILGLRQPLS